MIALRYACLLACIAGCSSAAADTAYPLPNAAPGIGFDDLRYSSALHRVLVPGGRAGVLALVEPETGAMTSIAGFSASPAYKGGHDFGVTSVDAGRGLLFATDRTTASLKVVDPASRTIIASHKLAAQPDYVRYVEPTSELWISEPDAEQLEIVSLSSDKRPVLARTALIRVQDGPESLVIDAPRGRAYTHRWRGKTVAFDVKTRAVVGDWKNGCKSSRGIELEPEHGFVFAACSEGTLSILDPSHDGKILSSVSEGAGYDVMGYNPKLRHAYLAGGKCACMTSVGVSTTGKLSVLGRAPAPSDTHCVVADDIGSAWVCAPASGSVRKLPDASGASH